MMSRIWGRMALLLLTSASLIRSVADAQEDAVCQGGASFDCSSLGFSRLDCQRNGCMWTYSSGCRGTMECSDFDDEYACPSNGCEWVAVNKDGFCTGDTRFDCDTIPSSECWKYSDCFRSSISGCFGIMDCGDAESELECKRISGCSWSNFTLDGFIGDVKTFFVSDNTIEDVYVSIDWKDAKSCDKLCRYTLYGVAVVIIIPTLIVLRGFFHNFPLDPRLSVEILQAFFTCHIEIFFGVLSFAEVVYHWDDDDVLTSGNKLWLICTGMATLVGGLMELFLYSSACGTQLSVWTKHILADNGKGDGVLSITATQIGFGFYPAIATIATTTISWGWIFWIAYVVFAWIAFKVVRRCLVRRPDVFNSEVGNKAERSKIWYGRHLEMIFIGAPLQIFESLVNTGWEMVSFLAVWMILRDIVESIRELEVDCCCGGGVPSFPPGDSDHDDATKDIGTKEEDNTGDNSANSSTDPPPVDEGLGTGLESENGSPSPGHTAPAMPQQPSRPWESSGDDDDFGGDTAENAFGSTTDDEPYRV